MGCATELDQAGQLLTFLYEPRDTCQGGSASFQNSWQPHPAFCIARSTMAYRLGFFHMAAMATYGHSLKPWGKAGRAIYMLLCQTSCPGGICFSGHSTLETVACTRAENNCTAFPHKHPLQVSARGLATYGDSLQDAAYLTVSSRQPCTALSCRRLCTRGR